VRLVLNDFLLNPGPSVGPLPAVEGLQLPADAAPSDDAASDPQRAEEHDDFGLMRTFIDRWRKRLPAALAAGVGAASREPPGNRELGQILDDFDDLD
jgi:hypothetical protein